MWSQVRLGFWANSIYCGFFFFFFPRQYVCLRWGGQAKKTLNWGEVFILKGTTADSLITRSWCNKKLLHWAKIFFPGLQENQKRKVGYFLLNNSGILFFFSPRTPSFWVQGSRLWKFTPLLNHFSRLLKRARGDLQKKPKNPLKEGKVNFSFKKKNWVLLPVFPFR